MDDRELASRLQEIKDSLDEIKLLIGVKSKKGYKIEKKKE